MNLIYKNTSKNGYYVYAYLRASNFTPYYIGKGSNDRAYDSSSHYIKRPKDKSLIIIMEKNLTELGALALERRLIRWYGRKDINYSNRPQGILHNKTDGGEGFSGFIQTTEHKRKNSEKQKLRPPASEKTRQKLKAANIGRIVSDKTKEQLRNIKKGIKWWNNGVRNTTSKECPGPNWVLGRLITEEYRNSIIKSNKSRIITNETRMKNSKNQTGLVFWNNGIENRRSKECPSNGWDRGKIGDCKLTGIKKSDTTRERMKLAWKKRKEQQSNKI